MKNPKSSCSLQCRRFYGDRQRALGGPENELGRSDWAQASRRHSVEEVVALPQPIVRSVEAVLIRPRFLSEVSKALVQLVFSVVYGDRARCHSHRDRGEEYGEAVSRLASNHKNDAENESNDGKKDRRHVANDYEGAGTFVLGLDWRSVFGPRSAIPVALHPGILRVGVPARRRLADWVGGGPGGSRIRLPWGQAWDASPYPRQPPMMRKERRPVRPFRLARTSNGAGVREHLDQRRFHRGDSSSLLVRSRLVRPGRAFPAKRELGLAGAPAFRKQP
jgi:hypothetical protein